MSGRIEVDTARLPLLLTELRLPAIGRLWAEMAERSDREGWPAARFLSTIAELEIAERARRRIERHLLDARLPPDKTLDGFDFAHVPMLSRARVTALASGDAWLNRGKNLLLFGPPGSGKTHISAAIGRTLVENGYRVLFTRTTELVQRLQTARQDLALEAAITKLDRYDLLVLDDLSYVRKDQAETSVLFELISRRYERRSMLITANQPLWRVEQGVPRSRHDHRRHRPPRPPLGRRRDECRKLPPESRNHTQGTHRHQARHAHDRPHT